MYTTLIQMPMHPHCHLRVSSPVVAFDIAQSNSPQDDLKAEMQMEEKH